MSEMQRGRRLRASDEERDYVLHLLQQAHAAGRIDIGELDERQGRVLTVKYSDEFVELVEDLPEGREVVAALRPEAAAPQPGRGSGFRLPVTGGGRDQSIAILSGKDILAPPGTGGYHLMSFMGGDNLDLTRAMGPGVVFILESQSVLGGSTIKVPPGVAVIDEAHAVLGGNTVKKRAQGDGSNGTLVLRGISILGGNTVKLA